MKSFNTPGISNEQTAARPTEPTLSENIALPMEMDSFGSTTGAEAALDASDIIDVSLVRVTLLLSMGSPAMPTSSSSKLRQPKSDGVYEASVNLWPTKRRQGSITVRPGHTN